MAIKQIILGTRVDTDTGKETAVSLTPSLLVAAIEHARALSSEAEVTALVERVVALSEDRPTLTLSDLSDVVSIGEEVTASIEKANQHTADMEYVFEELKGLGAVPDTRSDPKAFLLFAPKESMKDIGKYLIKDYRIGKLGSWDHRYLPVTLAFDAGVVIRIKVLKKSGSVSWTTPNRA